MLGLEPPKGCSCRAASSPARILRGTGGGRESQHGSGDDSNRPDVHVYSLERLEKSNRSSTIMRAVLTTLRPAIVASQPEPHCYDIVDQADLDCRESATHAEVAKLADAQDLKVTAL